MICGNEHAQEILESFISRIEEFGTIPFSFILIDGQSNTGKTTLVRALSRKFLGQYYQNDFLYIADLSEYLGGKHSLKIEVDDKDQYVDIPGEGTYIDLGARQIIEWMSKSPTGKYKIVLLENIERMTIQASNAFLKTLEESFKNVIIFATTSNRSQILDTILSRAFLVKFQTPPHDIVQKCLKDSYPDISNDKIDIICSFSMNRIGFAKKLIEKGWDNKNFDDLISYFQRFINLFDLKSDVFEKYSILVNVNKSGFLKIFLEALIFYYSNNKNIEKTEKILNTISKLDTNVGVENILFEMVL